MWQVGNGSPQRGRGNNRSIAANLRRTQHAVHSPADCRAAVMSARLSRISPAREGAWIGSIRKPNRPLSCARSSNRLVARPFAMLNTRPATPGASAASRLPSHDVGHVCEVARLMTVAIDRRPSSGEHRGEEQRNHGGIRAVGVLPGTENVEVTQGHGLETVGGRKRLAVQFGGQLGRSIGRNGQRQVAFEFRRGRPVAVGAARGGVNEPAAPGAAQASSSVRVPVTQAA